MPTMNTPAKRMAPLNNAAEATYLQQAEARRKLAHHMKRSLKCTYKEIAERLGVSRQRAHKMVQQVDAAKRGRRAPNP